MSDLPPRLPAKMRARYAYPLAILSGLALASSYPGPGIWPLAFVGVAGALAVIVGRGFWSGLAIGCVTGITFWTALIHWLNLYLGEVPWLALGIVMGVYFGLGCAVSAWACSRLLLWFRHRGVVWMPAVLAAIWVARETVSGLWPYGGFPWGRIALSQSNSPFAALSSWVGISGLSLIIVWVSAVPVAVVWWRCSRTEVEADEDRGQARRLCLVGMAVLIALVGAGVPAWGTLALSGDVTTTRVAAIQGNANAGLFAEHHQGEWLANHIAATEAADLTGVDLVVWPENSSDVDPEENSSARAQIDSLVSDIGVPLVFGTIQKRGEQYFNSSLLWEPGQGVVSTYDKRHPVPFAEYMPNRDFFHALAPDLVDLVPRNYTAGTTNGVFKAAGTSFGVNICFDIAYDDIVRDAVFGGASFIVSQTNNADFGTSGESAQQLAIAKMQAITNGRSMVSISTVGYSAIFGPDGSQLASAPRYTAAALIADVPQVSGIAPGTIVNVAIEIAGVSISLGVVCFVGCRCFSRRRHPEKKSPVMKDVTA